MTGVGTSFVGCIGAGLLVPLEALYVTDFHEGGSTVTRSLGAPPGIRAGNLMLACVSAGAYVLGDHPYTLTPDPAWTAVYEDPSSGLTNGIIPNIYSKVADASDAAGTSSYSWTITTSNLAGMAIAILGWPKVNGSTISSPSADYTLTPSLASPGRAWQFAFITQRTESNFAQPQPEPVVTSAATLLVPAFGSYRAGRTRIYASNNVSPITGAYLATISQPRQALVVAAISA